MDYKTKAEPKGMAGEVPVFCSHDEIIEVEKVIPNPKNPNQHPDNQIDLLGRIIKSTGWRQPITVSTRSGFVVKGHGRLMAAIHAGFTHVPVDYQNYTNEAEEYADLVADNRIAELSQVDNALLRGLFNDVDMSAIPAELTGFTEEEFNGILAGVDVEEASSSLDAEKYTDKVDIPQYEPTGKTATLDDCLDRERARDFLYELENAEGLSDEELEFLKLAATRFYAFNYKNIAEYYASEASPAMQRMMEKMALVIIDFDNAIANGYVVLSKDLQEVIDNEHEN